MGSRRPPLWERIVNLGGGIPGIAGLVAVGIALVGASAATGLKLVGLLAQPWLSVAAFGLFVLLAAIVVGVFRLAAHLYGKWNEGRHPPASPQSPPSQLSPPSSAPVAEFRIEKNVGDIHVHGESPAAGPAEVMLKGFDPGATHFSHQTIRITDFPLENEIFLRGKTFEHCIIQGPALVTLGRSVEFSESGFSTPHPDTLVWTAPAEDKPVDCVIVLDACAFRRCSFTKIGVVVPREYVEKFKDALTGKIRGFDIGNKGQLTDL